MKRSGVANQSGALNFSQVTRGKHQSKASAPGFSVKLIEGLELQVNTPATLSVALEVGAVSESIAVAAEATLVNTTDASLGNAVNTQAIIQLPSEARNPAGLLALQAGVTYVGQAAT